MRKNLIFFLIFGISQSAHAVKTCVPNTQTASLSPAQNMTISYSNLRKIGKVITAQVIIFKNGDADNDKYFTLPVGYRPSEPFRVVMTRSQQSDPSNMVANMEVGTDGLVKNMADDRQNGSTYMFNITFIQ